MQNTAKQYLDSIGEAKGREALQFLMQYIAGEFNTSALTTAGLVISATTTKAKTGAADCYCLVKGRLVKVAAGTDMAVLAGSVTNARFNVYVFFVDATGALTSLMATEATTLGGVKFPDFPFDRACLGFVIVNPTGTGPFVGGTTPLGDATVVPNAVYVSPLGAFDPTFLFT